MVVSPLTWTYSTSRYPQNRPQNPPHHHPCPRQSIPPYTPGSAPHPEGPSRPSSFEIPHLKRSASLTLTPRLPISGYHTLLLYISSRETILPCILPISQYEIDYLKYYPALSLRWTISIILPYCQIDYPHHHAYVQMDHPCLISRRYGIFELDDLGLQYRNVGALPHTTY